jgi:hypothetical protein
VKRERGEDIEVTLDARHRPLQWRRRSAGRMGRTRPFFRFRASYAAWQDEVWSRRFADYRKRAGTAYQTRPHVS